MIHRLPARRVSRRQGCALLGQGDLKERAPDSTRNAVLHAGKRGRTLQEVPPSLEPACIPLLGIGVQKHSPHAPDHSVDPSLLCKASQCLGGITRKDKPRWNERWGGAFIKLESTKFIFPAQVWFPEVHRLKGREQMNSVEMARGSRNTNYGKKWKKLTSTHF